MLALRLEYLTGRCVATAYNDRSSGEWPPHPARVFSALVAEWADGGGDPLEKAALEWLERQVPPEIVASDAFARDVVRYYVPVNDVSVIDGGLEEALFEVEAGREVMALSMDGGDVQGPTTTKQSRVAKALEKDGVRFRERIQRALKPSSPQKNDGPAGRAILTETRTRQPRTFPSVTPAVPVVYLLWPAAEPGSHIDPLGALTERVVRVGHSASLVACRVVDQTPDPSWVPDDSGPEVLRVAREGQLSRLEQLYSRHRESQPRVLPCAFQRYRRVGTAADQIPAQGAFGEDWIVLRRVGGPRLPLVRTVDVASAVRGALMSFADQPPLEVLSGHESAGKPSQRPHVAIVPLPFVGHRHADGSLLGVAIVLPRDLDPVERKHVLRAIGSWEEASRLEDEDVPVVPVQLGEAGLMELERVAWGEASLRNLRPASWCGPADVWTSVTPVALDRNPGDLNARNPDERRVAWKTAEAGIALACRHAGFPEPASVTALPSVAITGSEKARSFPLSPGGPASCGA